VKHRGLEAVAHRDLTHLLVSTMIGDDLIFPLRKIDKEPGIVWCSGEEDLAGPILNLDLNLSG
jgi:hypothetical protein